MSNREGVRSGSRYGQGKADARFVLPGAHRIVAADLSYTTHTRQRLRYLLACFPDPRQLHGRVTCRVEMDWVLGPYVRWTGG